MNECSGKDIVQTAANSCKSALSSSITSFSILYFITFSYSLLTVDVALIPLYICNRCITLNLNSNLIKGLVRIISLCLLSFFTWITKWCVFLNLCHLGSYRACTKNCTKNLTLEIFWNKQSLALELTFSVNTDGSWI